ncbi:hypothetical protein CBM2608_A50038 [Cupriavidus taiwanensis]|nr:hypothetical protein CBM2608_A50038 [Cupriavidus taiwanensis]
MPLSGQRSIQRTLTSLLWSWKPSLRLRFPAPPQSGVYKYRFDVDTFIIGRASDNFLRQ